MQNEVKKQISYSSKRAQFYSSYKERLELHFAKYENLRKIVLKVFALLYFLSAIFSFIITYQLFRLLSFKTPIANLYEFTCYIPEYIQFLTTPFGFNGYFFMPIFFFASVPLTYLLFLIFERKFQLDVKEKLMTNISEIFDNILWLQHIPLNELEIEELSLLPSFDEGEYDDYFKGLHNGVQFEIFNPTFFKTFRDFNDWKYRKQVFEGVVMKFSMNKKFEGHTIIIEDTIHHFSPNENLVRTVLEDVEFEKKYDVWTTDEIEARYLITTGFIDRLNNLKTKFLAKKIRCAFKDNSFYVIFKKSNAFEGGSLYRKLPDFELCNSMFEQILSIYQLIDTLKLELKIGM
ncbi:DUF3137 domain-containing protein [bacterium]|nr:DUF3137 domain-containing protein [bacterium]